MLFNIIILLFILYITLLVVKDLFYEDRIKRINKIIPSPSTIPIFGNLLQINVNDVPTSLDELYKKYGKIYRLRLGNVETVVVSGSELIDEIFTKNRIAQNRYIRLSRYLLKDKDIMYSNGDYHYKLRNVIMTEITVRKLNNNRLEVNKNVKMNLIDKINTSNKSVVENVPFLIKEFAIKLLIKFIYGTEESDELNKSFIDGVVRLFIDGGLFIYSDYIPLLFPLDLIKMSKVNILKDYFFFRDYSNKIIKKYEQRLDENANQNENDQENDFTKPLVEQYYKKYLDGEIKYESISFAAVDLLVAGLDSTSNTLGFLIAKLMNMPEIQEKIYNEIIMNNTQDDVSFGDHNKYPYTISVMNEAYRYYSIVPIAEPNICVEDISVNGYTIAKGTQIIKNLRSTHLSNEFWGDDASIFNPDRFYNRETRTLNEKGLYQFGAGSRACPGKRFAECVFFITLVLLIKNFKFVNPTKKPIDDSQIVALAMQCKDFDGIFIKRN